MPSLFDNESLPGSREPLQKGAVLLRGFVLAEALAVLDEVVLIAQAARSATWSPRRIMSVAMTSCGRVG
jgi:hypothetical protein